MTMTLTHPRSRATGTSKPAPLTLVEIGASLKRGARAKPNAPVEQTLSSKAQLTMIYCDLTETPQFFLRIARKGLSPLNDFSTPGEDGIGGAARLKRWQNEIKTFRRDFGIPANVEAYDGAEGLFYYMDLYWEET